MEERAGKSKVEFRLVIVVEPDEVGFHAYCPALKGLHTCGDTEDEALQNAKDAAIAYLHSLIKHGDPIPLGIVVPKRVKSTRGAPQTRVSHRTEDVAVAVV